MALTVQLMESPCVGWKTTLPHVNRTCVSPVFILKDSEAKFLLKGCWSQFEKDETWTIDLTTSRSLGPISVVTYLEKKNRELQRFGCCVQSRAIDKNYNSILYLTRKNLLDDGITEDTLSLLFVFHYNSCTKDVIRDPGFPRSSKRIRLGDPSVHSSCLQTFSEDIEMLFDKKEHSDVVLKCHNRSFFVSKKILSARSDVFAAMFRSEMAESETGVVTIIDMKSSVLEQFLRYLYSGRLESVCMESVFDLYRAGDKYAVTSLKWKCASFMVDNLTEKNICEVLLLADTFGDNELLDSAMCFAVERDGFLGSNTWNDFAKVHSGLAVEVYKKFHTQ